VYDTKASCSRFFGGRNVSGIIGILYTSVAFGTLLGPSAAGHDRDRVAVSHIKGLRKCDRRGHCHARIRFDNFLLSCGATRMKAESLARRTECNTL
jgi:hypothetical protein